MFCNLSFSVFMIPSIAPSVVELELLAYVSFITNTAGLNDNAPIITNQLLSRGIGNCVLVSLLMPDASMTNLNIVHMHCLLSRRKLPYFLVLKLSAFDCQRNKTNC